jgi:hypothetical protein
MILKIEKKVMFKKNSKTRTVFNKYFLLLLVIFNLSICLAQDNSSPKPIWLVVTKPMFVDSLKPLAEKRQNEGFETIISTEPVSQALAALPQKPAFLLLVGDCQYGQESQSWYVPSRICEAYMWNTVQDKNFASDAILGDLDGDLVPDIPVGRLPVRTNEQLQLLVSKILSFEKRPPTLDDLRLPIYTGSSEYSQVIDAMTTPYLLSTIDTLAAKWLRPWIISANPFHPLCGWPEEQGKTFTRELKQGGLMAALMGHGTIDYFYSMEFNGKRITYNISQATDLMTGDKPAPPLIIFACHCGNFTASRNCFTESLLFMPSGPVAAIGAASVSHPMTNYFAGMSFIRKTGQPDELNKRLGTLWLDVQKEAINARDIVMETLLLNAAGKLEEKVNAARIRRDHILLYNLLGDPATLLHMPEPLACKFEQRGDNWHWSVEKPKGALKLYVDFRPDGQSFPQVQFPLEKDSATKNLQLANDTFDFKPVAELNSDKVWEGTINKSGILRLVAVTSDNIYVATQKIDLNIQK